MSGRILVIDDEPAMLEACEETLVHHGYEVGVCQGADDGLEAVQRQAYDVVLLDLKLPGRDGLEVLRELKVLDPDVMKVMVTAFPTISTAVEAVREGAYDYLPKPFSPDQLLITVERAIAQKRLAEENARLRRALGQRSGFEGIIARSPAMLRVLDLVERLAEGDSSVVIEGETGTGKELIARSLHANGARRDGPFLPIDCGALPDTLLENELFGHERGAFTGADARKAGLLETAHGGTVFLDEIANLSIDLQVKLLRVLQERRVRRLGGHESIPVDFRLISAANENLERSMAEGRFRQDLYYRLNVVAICLPPLRERTGDVPLLADHFVRRLNEAGGKQVTGLAKAAVDALEQYSWPGNVRELENAIESAHSLCRKPVIDVDDLPARLHGAGRVEDGAPATFRDARERFEHGYLLRLLERVGGNVSRAASESGIHRSSLQRLMRRHGVRSEDFR